MITATLDSGALIGMERQKPRAMMLLRAAAEHRFRLLAPTPVVAEWWRGRTDQRAAIRRAVELVPLPVAAAEVAGIVLGRIPSSRERAALTMDVMVMAFAATHGSGLVYTADIGDIERLAAHFPSVRVLGV